jgi:hypothetical protein
MCARESEGIRDQKFMGTHIHTHTRCGISFFFFKALY